MGKSSIFEAASRGRLRFETSCGILSVDDLWDIKLEKLNETAVALNNLLKEESFISKKSKVEDINDLRFAIVKHVIKVRLQDIEDKENEVLVKAKKEKIIEAIANKEDEKLNSESIAKLKKMLADL